jgi:hypothetical protein
MKILNLHFGIFFLFFILIFIPQSGNNAETSSHRVSEYFLTAITSSLMVLVNKIFPATQMYSFDIGKDCLNDPSTAEF